MTRKQRRFTPEFKAQVVLDVLSGEQSPAAACRAHGLSPTLLSPWKATFLRWASDAFQVNERRCDEYARFAEPERVVGRLTMERGIQEKPRRCSLHSRLLAGCGHAAADYPASVGCGALSLLRSTFFARGQSAPNQPSGRSARAGRPLAELRLPAADGHDESGQPRREREAGASADARAGHRQLASTSQAAHDRRPRLTPLPEHGRGPGDRPPRAGPGGQHHLYPAPPGVRLPRRADGRLHQRHPGLWAGAWGTRWRRWLEAGVSSRLPRDPSSSQVMCHAAMAYIAILAGRAVAISIAAGKPVENGYAERLMQTIQEEVDLSEYEDLADARRQLGRYFDGVYNTKRIYTSLGSLTPAVVE